LWSKNGAWSSYSDPANEGFSWDLEMFHGPKTNQGTSSSKSCLAMDCDSAILGVSEVLIYNLKKVMHNMVWRIRAIYEEEIIMMNAVIFEILFVVLLFV
jgi:hypothetical protein